MTLSRAVLCRLLLILALVDTGRKFALANDDVCQGKKTKHLVQFLREEEVEQMQGHIESKAMLTQLVQSKDECKTQVDKAVEKAVESIKDLLGQHIPETKSQLEQLMTKMEKIEQLESTLEFVKTQVQEIQIATKLPDCQRWLQWADVSKANLFTAVGKHFYFNTPTAVNWFVARDWCAERGMRQASLRTLNEVQEVAKELKKLSDSTWLWLSANDIDRTPGDFRWVDGTKVDKALWHPGQPDSFGFSKRACVSFYTPYGKLLDESCSSSNEILCELPAALSSCL